jgi:hypothetical protein
MQPKKTTLTKKNYREPQVGETVVNPVPLTRSFTAVSGRTDILGMVETAPRKRLVEISTALKSNGWWADAASLYVRVTCSQHVWKSSLNRKCFPSVLFQDPYGFLISNPV